MRLGQKQEIFTRALALLLQYASFRGYEIRMGQVTRTQAEAKRLGFPNSNHTRRLAVDLNLFDREGKFLTRTQDHALLGEFWESLSGEYDGTQLTFCWGGFFEKQDGNHYSILHGTVR